MKRGCLVYPLPKDIGQLVIEPQVLAHFVSNKQSGWLAQEGGGQLFVTFEGPHVIRIVEATGPRSTDKRSPFGYRPDRVAEKIEIAERFSRGLHFVGDWHTHRQRRPVPSRTDERSMHELVQLSSHGLVGFVMIIVGQAIFPDGLHVSFHSKTEVMQLQHDVNMGNYSYKSKVPCHGIKR